MKVIKIFYYSIPDTTGQPSYTNNDSKKKIQIYNWQKKTNKHQKINVCYILFKRKTKKKTFHKLSTCKIVNRPFGLWMMKKKEKGRKINFSFKLRQSFSISLSHILYMTCGQTTQGKVNQQRTRKKKLMQMMNNNDNVHYVEILSRRRKKNIINIDVYVDME